MVTPTLLSPVLFKRGDKFEGFEIGAAIRTGVIQGWEVARAGGGALLYCRSMRKAASNGEIEAFDARARKLKEFASALVPDVIGFGYSAASRCYWLATEDRRRDGVDLRELFNMNRKLINAMQAMLLFARLADMLDDAHTAGIHHFDLLPGSIRITEKVELSAVLDLGLIEVFGAKPPRPTWETLPYCAPDLLREDLSPAVDIFAAGVILWEAIARRSPYNPKGAGLVSLDADYIDAFEALNIPTLTSIKAPVPEFVSVFVQRVTAKRKGERLNLWETVLNEVRDVTGAWAPILAAEQGPEGGEGSSDASAAPSSAAPASAGPSSAGPSSAAPSSAATSSAKAPWGAPLVLATGYLAAVVGLGALAVVLATEAPRAEYPAPPPLPVAPASAAACPSSSASSTPAATRPAPTPRPAKMPPHASERAAPAERDPAPAPSGSPPEKSAPPLGELRPAPEPGSRATLKRDWALR